ncbi:MAG: tetratricopeptide repeat protein [Steroidobacteraceae bacterium]
MPPGAVPASSAEREHEVTLDEALSIAVLLQQRGRLDDAEKIYRAVLEGIPEHADASHFLGVLAHQRGDDAEAAALIEALLARFPDNADAWSNLGIVRRSAGQLGLAAEAFRRAIALDARHANAYSNLAILLRAEGRIEEAEAAYRQAIAIDPEHARAWHNLGVLLEGRGQVPEAVQAYCRATVLEPGNAEAKRLLAHAYCTLGELPKAIEVLESWLASEPAHPIATHLLAACCGENVPGRASDACVESMFDSFASSFDAKLQRLRYQAPQLVARVLSESLPPPAKGLLIADLGCGTGLCGPLLAPYARELVGVDLSVGMLERARERAVYDELVREELSGYLARHDARFDVIVSADTLVYFGELGNVLAAMARALRPGGISAFTLEKAADEPASGYRLETHGRYTHAEGYVRGLLAALHLDPLIVNVELRMEAGRPVAGMLVRTMRRSGD